MEPLDEEQIAEMEALLVAQERKLINLKGKYIKQVLGNLEDIGPLDKQTRKIILDAFNDLLRDILRQLGYTVED